MTHRRTRRFSTFVSIALGATAFSSGVGVASAGAAEPVPGPPLMREQQSGLRPQWGVVPAPGADCPTGSARTVTLLSDDFEPGTTGPVQVQPPNASLVTEDDNTFARSSGATQGETRILQSAPMTVGKARLYVKFDVRGTFGSNDLAVTPDNGGGGWLVSPSSVTGVPATTWRTARLDLTDGANETTWGTALRVEWLRDISSATRVEIDNVEVYQCSPPPAPAPAPGDINGDGLADVKFIMNDGDLVAVAGTPSTPRTLWRAGSGWQNFTWISSTGDIDGDGYTDLLARAAGGDLYLYPGDGVRSFKAATKVGSGWGGMTSIIPVGDVDRDGRPDLIARSSDGLMRLYWFRADGRMERGRVVGSGWQNFRHVLGIRSTATAGTPSRLYAIAANGDMKSYTVTKTGSMTGWGKKVGNGWSFPRVSSVGDYDGDGLDDVVGVSSTGPAYVYPTNGDGRWKARLTLPEEIWHAVLVVG